MRKNFSTFFEKPLDKGERQWYNAMRYPKTAGSRKSNVLSCRGEIITL
jgi:hypothetical protein